MVNVVRPCWISALDPFNGMWHLSENGKPRGQFNAIVIAHNGNYILSYFSVPFLQFLKVLFVNLLVIANNCEQIFIFISLFFFSCTLLIFYLKFCFMPYVRKSKFKFFQSILYKSDQFCLFCTSSN